MCLRSRLSMPWLSFALPAVAVAAPGDVMRGSGFSFPGPLPALGQHLELVGHLDPSQSMAPFTMDPAAEYTWAVYGPVVHQVESSPGLETLDLTFGVLEIREDPSPDGQYTPDPPNAEVPSSFHDGSVVLWGRLTDLRIRDVFGLLSSTGSVRFEGGSSLASLGAVRDWTFDAAVSVFGGSIPAGFGASWVLELGPIAPVGVQERSWGGIKGLYR